MTWRKTPEYPMNPLEGLKEGETFEYLRERALEGMMCNIPQALRTASALEDWDELEAP